MKELLNAREMIKISVFNLKQIITGKIAEAVSLGVSDCIIETQLCRHNKRIRKNIYEWLESLDYNVKPYKTGPDGCTETGIEISWIINLY